MTSRECLGWHVPRPVRERFVTFVEEKWGTTDSYVRFELESAMREYLDRDGVLHEAEMLLREYLQSQGLSSSTEADSDERADHSDTVQLGYRVNEELKEEFATFAKQHYDENIGAILARAMDVYAKGGRRKRVLNQIHQLVTGGIAGDTTDAFDENGDTAEGADENIDGRQTRISRSDESTRDTTDESDENLRVDGILVSEIAGELGDQFVLDDLHKTITKKIDGQTETLELYSEAVISYENVVEHPIVDDLYIPEEVRDGITAYGDLDRESRTERLRALVAREALKKRQETFSVTYTEVQQLFELEFGDAPSHDYAYTLMEDAADEVGFSFKKRQGQKRLRVTLPVVRRSVLEDALDHPDVELDLNADLEDVELESDDTPQADDLDVTTFSAGAAPQQEVAGDD